MLENIKKIDIVIALLVLLSLNSIREINVAQALVCIGLFCLYAYNKWMEHIKKPDVIADIKVEMESLRSNISAEIDAVRSNMSSLMIKNSQKPAEKQEFKRFF